MSTPIHPGVRIGHVHMKVADQVCLSGEEVTLSMSHPAPGVVIRSLAL
jgi:hypothetical protein